MFMLNSAEHDDVTKTVWARRTHCDTDRFLLRSDVSLLRDQASLAEMPLSHPEKASLLVRVLGKKDAPKALSASLSMRVEELYSAARQLLGIASSLHVRFRHGGEILMSERTLRESCIDSCTIVDVEVGWRVNVRRENRTEGRMVTLFYSELLEAIENPHQRLLCGSRTLNSVVEAEELILKDLSRPRVSQLVLEISRPVSEIAQELKIPNGMVPRCLRSSLPPSCLLLHNTLRLIAVLTDGRRATLRVPRDGFVRDVLAAAAAYEANHHQLHVLLGSHVLQPNASLRAVGLRDDSQVELKRWRSPVCVQVGQRMLRWDIPADRTEVAFEEIVTGVASGSGGPHRESLMTGLLLCEGCGRALCRERQAMQRVPAACCEVRSMQLRFAVKSAPKDAAVQTDDQMPEDLPLPPPEVELPMIETADAAVQTDLMTESTTDLEVTSSSCSSEQSSGTLCRESPTRNIIVSCFISSEFYPVKVGSRESCWDRIKTQVVDTFNVLYQRKLLYYEENGWRSCVESVVNGHGHVVHGYGHHTGGGRSRVAYLDEADGRSIEPGRASFLGWEFFSSAQRLRSAPGGNPILEVSACDVLRCLEVSGRPQLYALKPSALFDPAYLCLVSGFRFLSHDGECSSVFLQTDRGYVESATGATFADFGSVCASHLVRGCSPRLSLLLFRANDVVPRWPLPMGQYIRVLRRQGVDLHVSGHRLCETFSSAPISAESSCWIRPTIMDDLDREFNKSARS